MRSIAAVALLVALTACGSSTPREPKLPPPAKTEAGTQAQTCAEVQLGIDAFNDQDYVGTMKHFKRAEVYAKVHAREWGGAEAAALLQAVDYYAHLPPEAYPNAARTSVDFQRFTVPTLSQCGKDAEDGDLEQFRT
jgi:predicted small lipoprotein YifL